jgi:uncharacterized membrane protein YfcA
MVCLHREVMEFGISWNACAVGSVRKRQADVIRRAVERGDRQMNTAAMWGWIGGIAGGVVGLAGGLVGTYFSIKNTHGPRERSFMVKSATVCWIAVLTFLGLLLFLPPPYRWLTWIPYSILLPLGITFGNRRQQAIRQEESAHRRSVSG